MPAIFPSHYRVIHRKGTKWHVKGSELCSNRPVGLRDIHDYGLTVETVLINLFRVNGGRQGYYIADLKKREYYFCGTSLDGVTAQFRSLGIGRVNPND